MFTRLTMLCAAVAVCSSMAAAQAAGIYRWTDEQGKAHASDRPPAGVSPDKVRREDSRAHELTRRQREEAKARALADKSLRDQGLPVPPPAHGRGGLPLTVSPVPDKQPDETECQRMVRLYRESEACFAPYKIANGKTRLRPSSIASRWSNLRSNVVTCRPDGGLRDRLLPGFHAMAPGVKRLAGQGKTGFVPVAKFMSFNMESGSPS